MKSDQEVEAKVIETIADVVKDSDWAPPEGGVLVDVLVVMIHVDSEGDRGCSWINTGSLEQAEGMARRVVRSIEFTQQAGMEAAFGQE